MKLSSREIRYRIVAKMVRHKFWGGRHTSFDNISKGIPTHLQKEIEKEAKQLIKEGIILSKPTGYGLEVSLNPRMKKEIEWIIREGI